jgi:hypothetical protein
MKNDGKMFQTTNQMRLEKTDKTDKHHVLVFEIWHQ